MYILIYSNNTYTYVYICLKMYFNTRICIVLNQIYLLLLKLLFIDFGNDFEVCNDCMLITKAVISGLILKDGLN